MACSEVVERAQKEISAEKENIEVACMDATTATSADHLRQYAEALAGFSSCSCHEETPEHRSNRDQRSAILKFWMQKELDGSENVELFSLC